MQGDAHQAEEKNEVRYQEGDKMHSRTDNHTAFVNADLEDVYMYGADAEHADFRGSVLREIKDPPFRAMACPSHGAFKAWMKGFPGPDSGSSHSCGSAAACNNLRFVCDSAASPGAGAGLSGVV